MNAINQIKVSISPPPPESKPDVFRLCALIDKNRFIILLNTFQRNCGIISKMLNKKRNRLDFIRLGLFPYCCMV